MSALHQPGCVQAPFCECAAIRIRDLEAQLTRRELYFAGELAQARDAALEEAARMCEEADGVGGGPILPLSFVDMAEAFRALKGTPGPRLYTLEEVIDCVDRACEGLLPERPGCLALNVTEFREHLAELEGVKP